MPNASRSLSALSAPFVVTVVLSACGAGNGAGANSSNDEDDQAAIAHALKYHPACPQDIQEEQPCTEEQVGAEDKACVQADQVGPCGPIEWYCREQKWQREVVSCNPPEAFE